MLQAVARKGAARLPALACAAPALLKSLHTAPLAAAALERQAAERPVLLTRKEPSRLSPCTGCAAAKLTQHVAPVATNYAPAPLEQPSACRRSPPLPSLRPDAARGPPPLACQAAS